jgi:hypothetical protein
MTKIPLDKVFDLLGTQQIPGSEKELDVLCIRIGELVEMNGDKWVKENRKQLLVEWDYVVCSGSIN